MGLYSVGMVMKHKRYQYHCVIYGWDAVCKQSKVIKLLRELGRTGSRSAIFVQSYKCVMKSYFFLSKVWISQMGVDRLRWKEKQPFYNVLVEDGSCRYAASENLFPTKPQRIVGNPQVKNSIKYHRI